MNNTISTDTIVRTIVLALALINNVLTMMGLNPLPFSNDEMYEGVSCFITTVVAVWAWWKNNSFTDAAITADQTMKKIKSENK